MNIENRPHTPLSRLQTDPLTGTPDVGINYESSLMSLFPNGAFYRRTSDIEFSLSKVELNHKGKKETDLASGPPPQGASAGQVRTGLGRNYFTLPNKESADIWEKHFNDNGFIKGR